MSLLRKCVPVVIFFCLGHPAAAQKLRFKQLTAEEGLSSNFVRSVLQDDKGFMWFGTQDGLNRYDGYTCKVYRHRPGDSTSLSGSEVTCLAQATTSSLLVGTKDGLNRLDIYTGKATRFAGVPRDAEITALLVTDSAVLAGTSRGLYLLSEGRDSLVQVPFDDSAYTVECVGIADGSIFVGTRGHGAWRLGSGGRLQKVIFRFPEFLDLDSTALRTVTSMRQYGDRIYIGTDGHGVFKIDRSLEVQSHLGFENLPSGARVIRDFTVRNNSLYAATAYGVVVCHLISGEIGHYTRQETIHGINSNPCNALFMDGQNNIWVGTDLGGVNVSMGRSLRFPLSQFSFETLLDNVYAFAEAAGSSFFIGGDRLLTLVDPITGKTDEHSEVLGAGTVRCLYHERPGVLWIGTWGNGLIRYDYLSRRSIHFLNEEQGSTVLALFAERGQLFVSTAGGGVFRIDLASQKVARHYPGNDLSSVNCFFRDSKGSLWMGTYDGGLVLAADVDDIAGFRIRKIFRTGTAGGKLPSNVVYSVNESHDGRIWAATASGLCVMNPDSTFYAFGEKQGPARAPVYSILRDSTGQFWMSSASGLIRFFPKGNPATITFRTYGTRDGLVNTSFNMGAALYATSGLIFAGGPKGFNVFRPSSVKENHRPAPVYVVGYRVHGKAVSSDTLITYRKFISIDWDSNNFQFEFASLDFTDPARNLFSFMLAGFDQGWSDPSPARFASYSNLPGGTYTFMVKGANNDGAWNEKPWQVTIEVIPPFWSTTPFLVLLVMAGIALVMGVSSVRTLTVRRENVMLERKVAERTRELQERNREITSSIEYAKRIQEAILPSKDHIFSRLKKVFILYKPKDIVSGDFYWFAERDGVKIFAVVDCTGHGVPGAFMSMIGHNLLDQVVNEYGITDPGEILIQLHRGVLQALRQGHNEVNMQDGMDVSLICINDLSREVRWAGANRPLIMIDANGSLKVYQGNKDPVGGVQAHPDRTFTTHVIQVEVASMAYLFTDGYADQFGGGKGKKFMVKRLHEILATVHRLDPSEQQAVLERNFDDWKREQEQVDDVLIVGIEI